MNHFTKSRGDLVSPMNCKLLRDGSAREKETKLISLQDGIVKNNGDELVSLIKIKLARDIS